MLDELWLTYYHTTFNPARVRMKAMVAEMPKHYWRNMPETALIPDLVAAAPARVAACRRSASRPAGAVRGTDREAHAQLPNAKHAFAQLRSDAELACSAARFHGPATQAVFGEGPADAQPRVCRRAAGRPGRFRGAPLCRPRRTSFRSALGDAGSARERLYVTNAVKHFKYEPRGKRRIHQKPNAGEVHHCRWWLDREFAVIKPKLVVALGATAAHSLAGRAVSVLRARGPMDFRGRSGFVTVHPSFLLRLPDVAAKKAEYEKFVADLRHVRHMIAVGVGA